MLVTQHSGLGRSLVGVVLKNVPSAEDQVFGVRQRYEFFDQRRTPFGALAQADRAHLCERAHRTCFVSADELDARHERGAHRAHSRRQDAQFSLRGRNFSWLFHAAPLAHDQNPYRFRPKKDRICKQLNSRIAAAEARCRPKQAINDEGTALVLQICAVGTSQDEAPPDRMVTYAGNMISCLSDRGLEEAFMVEITIRIPDSVLKTVLLVVAGVTVSWQ